MQGDVGFEVLPEFLNLRHLDLSFTDLEKDCFRTVMTSLCHLQHLNLSGTSITWYEVFSTADVFASDGLKELFMHSLVIMSASDWEAGKSCETTVEDFFGKVQRLLTLDVSYALVIGDRIAMDDDDDSTCDQRFHVTLSRILRCVSSLTHLDVSNNCGWDVLEDLLVRTNRLDKLRFLGNILSDDIFSKLPETLSSRPSLKLAISSGIPDVLSFEYQFHQNQSLKNGRYFYYANPESIGRLMETEYDRFVTNGLVPLTTMLCTAARRCLTDVDFFEDSSIASLLSFSIPALLCTDCPFMKDALEQMLQNVLLFTLRHKTNRRTDYDDTKSIMMSLLAKLSTFVYERPVLLNLALQYSLFVCAPAEAETSDKWDFLTPALLALPPTKWNQMASKIGPQLMSNLTSIGDEICDVTFFEKSIKDWVKDLVKGATSLLNAFVILFCGMSSTDFLCALGGCLWYEVMADFAMLAFDLFLIQKDEPQSKLYVASMEALAVIAEYPDLAPALLSKRFIYNILSPVPSEKSMYIAHSYLVCLLLVNGQSAKCFRSNSRAKQRLASDIFIGDHFDVEFTYRQATLSPLLKIARSGEFVSVAAFGLQRLAFICSTHFEAEAYHRRYPCPCPLCLIRQEVGFDALSFILVPSVLQSSLNFDLNLVSRNCRTVGN